ncbi:helix-turn-helix domain-containing protein [Shewanella amazonensis]|uniref:Putative transcriptional regulator, MerR family n=1 Tax=Shewanella amazonensis (strain ATCC BAA-1098 / SB2B) TaxID=326297 RepID=A1SAZ3_SHEAM|nr:helix-turn-helix domain-containing protein [Shewanella amazonensis]ABM01550.1 putative transcriptional regulator, MerR family [Shewanella amazonensis SB2B]
MDISQVAKQSGVAASRLRYYEEKGLIRAIGRDGLKRVFSPGILERLALIALGQSAGFSLDEIAGMLGRDGNPEIDKARLVEKADELDGRIKRLCAMRDGLRHAAQCSAPSYLECPKFQRLMQHAAKADKKQRQSGAARQNKPPR